jgi:hypothetical protein
MSEAYTRENDMTAEECIAEIREALGVDVRHEKHGCTGCYVSQTLVPTRIIFEILDKYDE